MSSSINLNRLLQSTLTELEKSEQLDSDSQTMGELRNSIVRTMAELELAKANRRESEAQNLHLVSAPEQQAHQDDEDEQASSAVA